MTSKKKRHPIRRVKHVTKCVMVRMPDHVADELMRHVDGIHFRSRAQLINVILVDWLSRRPVK